MPGPPTPQPRSRRGPSAAGHRRALLVAVLLAVALGLVRLPVDAAPGAAPLVVVFLPTAVRPPALAQALEAGLGEGIEVRAFGRFTDFTKAIQTQRPAAILTHAVTLEFAGLPVHLRGALAEAPVEPLLLVSRGEGLERVPPEQRRYGAVDLVGRSRLPGLVAQWLEMTTPPTISRVVKYEDLLPLLQFEEADAVLLPEWVLADFQRRSRLPFRIERPPAAQLQRAAISLRGSATHREELRRRFQRLGPQTLALLRIDGWTHSTLEPKAATP